MTEKGILILRLALAGINGILFAVGLYVILEYMRFRPNRWRNRLKWLIYEVERQELSEDEPLESDSDIQEKREKIAILKERLASYRRDPHHMLRVFFGALMVSIALLALFNLLFPAFAPFR